MIIIHHNRSMGLNRKTALKLIREQTHQKKVYTGRIRLWIEMPAHRRTDIYFVKKIQSVLAGICYRRKTQVYEIIVRKMPGKTGISIMVQNLDGKRNYMAGYDYLTDYILIPDLHTVQAVSRMNETERNKWRKIRRNETAHGLIFTPEQMPDAENPEITDKKFT